MARAPAHGLAPSTRPQCAGVIFVARSASHLAVLAAVPGCVPANAKPLSSRSATALRVSLTGGVRERRRDSQRGRGPSAMRSMYARRCGMPVEQVESARPVERVRRDEIGDPGSISDEERLAAHVLLHDGRHVEELLTGKRHVRSERFSFG